ncbi:MAG: asparaginase domain-containing protein [Bacteroidetes bacterium]|nr:asparaginase domain-containing protein [Bacteroidota bacterium]MDA1226300.1 asparaginase domain-containing protein [Bacteroidota bacterium]
MIEIITTGGTIDKVYFDKNSNYQVGDPFIVDLLTKMNVNVDYQISPLMKVDSLDMNDSDRKKIFNHIAKSNFNKILITHGTDTIVDTATYLNQQKNKTIVLTGSLKPALFVDNDAIFNIGCAFTAVQTLSKGVYVIMNGQIFEPSNCRKNKYKNIFEKIK